MSWRMVGSTSRRRTKPAAGRRRARGGRGGAAHQCKRRRWRSTLPPSVLPDISPTSGEIGRPRGFRQSPALQIGEGRAMLPISPLVGEMSGSDRGGREGSPPWRFRESIGRPLLDEHADAGRAAGGVDDRQRRGAGAVGRPAGVAAAFDRGQRLAVGEPAERRAAALDFQHQRRSVAARRAEIDARAFGREHDLRRRFGRPGGDQLVARGEALPW